MNLIGMPLSGDLSRDKFEHCWFRLANKAA